MIRLNYFRPTLQRENFLDLNGKWKFVFDDANVGEKNKFYESFPEDSLTIKVPFSYETPLSGINDSSHHNHLWYSKDFSLEEIGKKKTLIHFEGSDYKTKVYINSSFVGEHIGGYERFSFDISNFVKKGKNTIVVYCYDSLDKEQPRGKQRYKEESFGCWYIQTTGIYKSVWIEQVNSSYIESLFLTPSIEKKNLHVALSINESKKVNKIEFITRYKNTVVAKHEFNKNFEDLTLGFENQNLNLWSFKTPNLYYLDIVLKHDDEVLDKVSSYFAFREFYAHNSKIYLNKKELYLKLILAQNYWEDSGLTIKDTKTIKKEIDYLLRMGFNGMRIHQKTEDERFLYYCDLKGIYIWSEFPATYIFNEQAKENIRSEWPQIVKQFYNHPCIMSWVPFNESWGIDDVFTDKEQQEFVDEIYDLIKGIDKTRFVISNDGWELCKTDLVTLHDYDIDSKNVLDKYSNRIDEITTNKLKHGGYKYAIATGYKYEGQPIIVSEYGGSSLTKNGGWGYVESSSKAILLERFDSVTSAIQASPFIAGYCYTQMSDVYQEQNGLLNFKHKQKLNLTTIKKVNDKKENR